MASSGIPDALELGVGFRFNDLASLEAAVAHWAKRNETVLGVQEDYDRTIGVRTRRWRCTSWIYEDLPCKLRDCLMEIEASQLPVHGDWVVGTFSTRHMAETEWNDWSAFEMAAAAVAGPSWNAGQDRQARPYLSGIDDSGFDLHESTPQGEYSQSDLQAQPTIHNSKSPGTCSTSTQLSRRQSCISDCTVQSSHTTLPMQTLLESRPMDLKFLCHSENQTPPPSVLASISASPAAAGGGGGGGALRTPRIPFSMRGHRERRLKRGESLAGSASTIAEGEAGVSTLPPQNVPHTDSTITSEQPPSSESSTCPSIIPEEPRSPLSILASQAAHRADDEKASSSALSEPDMLTNVEQADLGVDASLSSQLRSTSISNGDVNAGHNVGPYETITSSKWTLQKSMVSGGIHFSTLDYFVEWASERLAASHPKARVEKKYSAHTTTVSCRHNRKEFGVSCTWKLKAARTLDSNEAARWDVTYEDTTHSSECLDLLKLAQSRETSPKVVMNRKARSPAQTKADYASQQRPTSVSRPKKSRKRTIPFEAQSSASSVPHTPSEDAMSSGPEAAEESDHTSSLSPTAMIPPSSSSTDTDTLDHNTGELSSDSIVASHSVGGVDLSTFNNAGAPSESPPEDSATHVPPTNDNEQMQGRDVVVASPRETSHTMEVSQYDVDKATSAEAAMPETSEAPKPPGAETAVVRESLIRVDESSKGKEGAPISPGQSEDDWQPAPLDGEMQIEEPEWPVPQPEEIATKAISAEQRPLGEGEDRDTSGAGHKMNDRPPLHIDTTASAQDGERERTPDLVTSVGPDSTAHGASHSPPSSPLTPLSSDDEPLMLSVVTLPSNNTSAKRKIAPRAASSARKVKRKTAANRGLTVQTSDCATKPKAAQDHDNDSSAGEESVKPCKQRGVHANAKAAGLGRSVEQKRKSSTGPAGRGRSLGFGKDGSLRLYMNSKRRKLFGSDSEDEESVPVALANARGLTREPIQAGRYMYMKSDDDGEDDALEVRDVSSAEEHESNVEEQDTDSESNSRNDVAMNKDSSEAGSASLQAILATAGLDKNPVASENLEMIADSITGGTLANDDAAVQPVTGLQPSEDVTMTEDGLPGDDAAPAPDHEDEDLIVKAEEPEELPLNIAGTSTPAFAPTIFGPAIANTFRRSATMSDHESAYISRFGAQYHAFHTSPPPTEGGLHHASTSLSPTIPHHQSQQAFRELEEDLSHQEEERYNHSSQALPELSPVPLP